MNFIIPVLKFIKYNTIYVYNLNKLQMSNRSIAPEERNHISSRGAKSH